MVDNNQNHILFDKWTFWAHLPHDTDWSLKSYHKLTTVSTVEEVVTLNNIIPDEMICNCMIFVMRENIYPLWEDKNNKDGGSFSFKIENENVHEIWKEMVYRLVGEHIFDDENTVKKITGITISPKKNFCIFKIWLKDCSEQNIGKLKITNKININGCLFKKHTNGHRLSTKSIKI